MYVCKFQSTVIIPALMGAVVLFSANVSFAENTPINEPGTVERNVIVVRGERVERPIQETASSVAVFDEQSLSEQAVSDRIEQIMDLVPNLQRGSGDVAPAIRGQDATGILIGANAFLGGTRPRATLQVDGRALNFNEFIYGLSSIWDVQQIEVFRGPQTTSQGRNAIAGAIFIKTNDPTYAFEGAARAVVGNYGTHQTSLALSGPLVNDQVAARIAVDWREHESWMQYTTPDVFVGANREDDNYGSARAKLLITPKALPNLRLLLTYTHLDANNPQGETADEPYDKRVQNVQNTAHWSTVTDAMVLNADYALSSSWEASVTGTYADSDSERFSAPGRGTADVKAKESSIESLLRFAPSQGRVHGLLGVAYFNAEQNEISDLSAFLGFGDFIDIQRSFGVFGQATYDVTSQLHFTLGGRWQEDTQDRKGALGPVSLNYDETFDAFLPKMEIAYDLNTEIIIGATARKGYNPGGTTISFTTGAIDEFEEETLWSYELFTRANLADGDLTLSGNLFFTDFTNAQRPLVTFATLPSGEIVESTEFANAPSAESYGMELESLWVVNPQLQIRAAVGLLKSKITQTLTPSDPIVGREFQRAPSFTGMFGISFQPIESLTLDLNARRNSDYFSDDANTPAFKIDGLTLVDAKATYHLGRIDIFAFVRNATDETHRVWQFRPGNASLGDPREYGIGLKAHF